MTSGSHSPFLLTNIVANRLLIPSSEAEPGGVSGDGSPWWSTSVAGPANTTSSSRSM
jgi:hypothetical protein